MISEESKFLLHIHTTHRHTHAHSVFSSLSCPAGSHQTLSVKPAFFAPTGRIHRLTFICTNLLCFDIGGASLLLGLCCFNLSAACLSNATKQKPIGEKYHDCHRARSRPLRRLWYHVRPASPLWALSSSSLFLSLPPHRCTFFLLSRYKETQERVTQLPLHLLWLQIPFDHIVDTLWNWLKYIYWNEQWWIG